MLTSPVTEVVMLEGAPSDQHVAEATEENIRSAAAWIAQALGEDRRAVGLVTYSGHGDWIERKGLAICPADTQGSHLEHAILTEELAAAVEPSGAGSRLTVVLDCCHAGAEYLLVVLARARLGDMQSAPGERGWIERREVCRMLAVDNNRLGVDIYRIRRQLGELGVHGAADIIARRPATGQLRIGTERVEVVGL